MISATEPLTQAWERMMTVCFRPFDLNKWLVLGASSWLATFAEGGSGNLNIPSDSGAPTDANELGPMVEEATRWFEQNIDLIIGGAVALALTLFVLGFVITWVKSRAEFVFIDGVVKNRGAFWEPWRQFAVPGKSLFLVRVVVDGGFFASMLMIVGLVGYLIWGTLQAGGGPETLPFGAICVAAPILTVLILGYAFFSVLLRDVVVPVMYSRNTTFRAAWSDLSAEVLPGNWGVLLLYFLVKMGVGMGVGVVAMLATVMTCCLAALPYVGAVVLLPTAVFMRSYSLYFVEQFGPQYTLFGTSEGD